MAATKDFLAEVGRVFLVEQQGGVCCLCGRVLHPRFFAGPKRGTVEHVWPKSQGNPRRGNTLISHEACNSARGDDPPTGCLIIMLQAVNRALGLREDESAYYDRPWKRGEADVVQPHTVRYASKARRTKPCSPAAKNSCSA